MFVAVPVYMQSFASRVPPPPIETQPTPFDAPPPFPLADETEGGGGCCQGCCWSAARRQERFPRWRKRMVWALFGLALLGTVVGVPGQMYLFWNVRSVVVMAVGVGRCAVHVSVNVWPWTDRLQEDREAVGWSPAMACHVSVHSQARNQSRFFPSCFVGQARMRASGCALTGGLLQFHALTPRSLSIFRCCRSPPSVRRFNGRRSFTCRSSPWAAC